MNNIAQVISMRCINTDKLVHKVIVNRKIVTESYDYCTAYAVAQEHNLALNK